MSEQTRDLEQIRQELLERKRELDIKLAQRSQEKATEDTVQDPGDQALSSTMELLRSSLQDAEIEEYNRIVRALSKIDDGTYGICVDCGGNISEKRLNLNPNSSRCLVCQEAFEEQAAM